jgi:pilus assembly protein CpaB
MTPAPPESPPQQRSQLALGVMIGLLAGIVIASCTGGVVGYTVGLQRAEKLRKGWNLVPVVVAAVDIPAGTAVTFENISQRSVPEQFVTGSVILPASAGSIINQKVLVPLRPNDPLLWSQFGLPAPGTR